MKSLTKHELLKRFDKIQKELQGNVDSAHRLSLARPTLQRQARYEEAVNELHEFLNSAKQQVNLFKLIVKSNGWLAAIVFAAVTIGGALGWLLPLI